MFNLPFWPIGLMIGISFLAGCNLTPRPSFHADSKELADAVAWLDGQAGRMIRESMRPMASGIHAFPPQVGSGYEAFWLRDYAYMLEGKIDAFTDKELKDACLLFVKAQRADGAMVDCVKFDGTAIYKPGYGTMGENPVADGSPFTVSVAWHTCRKINDPFFLKTIIEPLIRGMSAVPLNPKTHLVTIDPKAEWDRCPYGFTDTVRKKGDVFFCSLLYVRAAEQLADLLDLLTQTDQARQWRDTAATVSQSIRTTFWDDETGLFRAATICCREHDIWGSAYAVRIGVADDQQAMKIATYFQKHYHEIVKRGQLRHTPGGVYWEEGPPRETYQNGAYWGTPVGWFVYTLDRVDSRLADQTLIDMVNDFKANGIYECINDGGYTNIPRYIASTALPLEGICTMLDRRIAK